MTPAQMKAELKRLSEENEELRYRVKEHDRLKAMGTFTIADVMQMRGVEGQDDICVTCTGLGVFPIGTGDRCHACGGSGSNKVQWAVLQ